MIEYFSTLVVAATFKIKSDEIFLMKRDTDNYLLTINFTSHSGKIYTLTRQKIVSNNVWTLGDNHTITKMSENVSEKVVKHIK